MRARGGSVARWPAALLWCAVAVTARGMPAVAAGVGDASVDAAGVDTAGREGEDDAAALSLPPPAPAAGGAGRPVSLTVEGAAARSDQRVAPALDEARASFDLHYDERWSAAWRTIVDDRLDLDRIDAPPATQWVNVLKQAYVSDQVRPDLLVDVGRVNARQGVAFGYNPTDLFRADALRTVESLDPDSLRDNRLGSVMVRTQRFWDDGAFTASLSPRLAAAPTTGPFAADWGATNSRDRWQLALTERLGAAVSPQWLLSGSPGAPPQLGVNLTGAIGGATVAYLEASAGRSRSAWAAALDLPGTQALRARAAAGATYSTVDKLSLTLEYEYDGAAPGSGTWTRARRGDPRSYGLYRAFASAQQDPATREGALAYVSWQDMAVRHLDLAAFVRVDLIDRSRLPWLELRYRFTHADAALRWQDTCGDATSDYGALPARQTWQLVLDYYL